MEEARAQRLFKQRVYKEKVSLNKCRAERIIQEATTKSDAIIREAEEKADVIRRELDLSNARLQVELCTLAQQKTLLEKEKEALARRESVLLSRESLCREFVSCSAPDDVSSEPERRKILARLRQRRFYARKVADREARVSGETSTLAPGDTRQASTEESLGAEEAPNRSNRRLNSVVQSMAESFKKATVDYNVSARRLVLSKFWRHGSLQEFQPMKTCSSKVELAKRSIIGSLKASLQIVKGAKRKDHYMAKYTMLQGVCGSMTVKSRLHSEIARVLDLKRANLYRASKKRALLDGDSTEKYPTGIRRPRSDRMSDELVSLITDWWHNNTRVSPNKRDSAQKRIGVLKYFTHPVHWLEETEVELFLRFQEFLRTERPELTVGLRSFQSRKPFYIRTLKDRNVCCCKQHVEMDMLRQSLHYFRQSMHGKACTCDCTTCVPNHAETATCIEGRRCSLLDTPLASVRLMSESILCPRAEGALWHKKSCIMGSCKHCGINLLPFCKQELEASSSEHMVKWESFEYVTLDGKKQKKPPPSAENASRKKPAVRLRLVENETTIYKMIEVLKVKLPAFVKHNFRQRWQSEQFQLCFKTFPPGTVLSVIDFAENYTFKFQNEIMAQHWDNQMCTILVHITYRHALELGSEREIITDYHFYISDDNNHDTLFVQHCLEKHWKWMCVQNIPITNHIVWSDGCAAQFKACRPFYYVARYGNWHKGVKMCWNFFGSGHGKGVHDGAGGTVKSALSKEQLKLSGGANLRDATDAVKFLKERFQLEKSMEYGIVQGVRRHFWLIEENEVNRRKRWDCSQIQGTRKLHCFYGFNPETSTQLYTRELSCFCMNCQQGHFLSCSNLPWVGQFKLNIIEPKSPADVADELRLMGNGFDGNDYDHGSLSDLVREGDIFAVEAGKPNPWGAEFYVHICTHPLHQYLGEDFLDEHGLMFYCGDWVIKGLWYEQTLGSLTSFSLKQNQKASYIHADLVRHIRFGMKPTPHAGYYTLSPSTLARIMASLKECW